MLQRRSYLQARIVHRRTPPCTDLDPMISRRYRHENKVTGALVYLLGSDSGLESHRRTFLPTTSPRIPLSEATGTGEDLFLEDLLIPAFLYLKKTHRRRHIVHGILHEVSAGELNSFRECVKLCAPSQELISACMQNTNGTTVGNRFKATRQPGNQPDNQTSSFKAASQVKITHMFRAHMIDLFPTACLCAVLNASSRTSMPLSSSSSHPPVLDSRSSTSSAEALRELTKLVSGGATKEASSWMPSVASSMANGFTTRAIWSVVSAGKGPWRRKYYVAKYWSARNIDRSLTCKHQFQPRSDVAVPLQTKQPRDDDDSESDNKYRRRDLLLHVCVPRAIPLKVTVAHALVVEAPARPTHTRECETKRTDAVNTWNTNKPTTHSYAQCLEVFKQRGTSASPYQRTSRESSNTAGRSRTVNRVELGELPLTFSRQT